MPPSSAAPHPASMVTPVRNVRIGDELWSRSQALLATVNRRRRAERLPSLTMSHLLRLALEHAVAHPETIERALARPVFTLPSEVQQREAILRARQTAAPTAAADLHRRLEATVTRLHITPEGFKAGMGLIDKKARNAAHTFYYEGRLPPAKAEAEEFIARLVAFLDDLDA